MSTKRRRSRVFFGMRNYKFETDDKFRELDEVQDEKQELAEVKKLTEAEWKAKIKEELEAVDFEELAYIFHDRDREDQVGGALKTLHVHFVVRFENARDYEPMMEKFGCEPRNFERAKVESSALLYLTHTTAEAIKAKKTRYNVSELNVLVQERNEDGKKVDGIKRLAGEELEEWYRQKIARGARKTDGSLEEEVARIIDDLAEGEMSIADVKADLKETFDATTATMTWMKNKRYFKEAVLEYYESKYLDWLEKGRTFNLLYVNGPAGVGKTRFAREIAKRVNKAKGLREVLIHNAPNDSKMARYDFLSGYNQEAVTVFDDLNPTTFGYTEFLNLFEKERVAKYSSRFNDKAWFAEVAIITKSTPIQEWTEKLAYSELKGVKLYNERQNILYQPRRRFSLIIDINHDRVQIFNYVLKDKKKNNQHEMRMLREFEADAEGIYEPKFQDEVLDSILRYLGLAEATAEEMEELQKISEDDEKTEV